MTDYLDPAIGWPLVIAAWIVYVIVVKAQNRKEKHHG